MSCICPVGYTANTTNNFCERILTTAATFNGLSYTVAKAGASFYNSILGAVFYEDISNFDFPIQISASTSYVYTTNGTQLFNTNYWVDQSNNILSPILGGPGSGFTCVDTSAPFTLDANVGCVTNNTYGPPFFRSSIWGGLGGSSGRLNSCGIWVTSASTAPPFNEWIGFSRCIIIPSATTYYIGLGGDNLYRFKINGELIVNTSGSTPLQNTAAQFQPFGINPNTGSPVGVQRGIVYTVWSVFPFTFNPGLNVIEMEGLNIDGPAAFGVEIYSGSLSAITAVTTTTQLSALTVFSSFDTIGSQFDLGTNSGFECPDGYSLVVCSGSPYCAQILQTPCIGGPSPTPTPTMTPTPTPTPLPQVFVNECEPITLLAMSATCSVINLTNTPGSTKSMVVDIIGGTPPYTVTWSDGTITSGISPQSINNLSAGTYTANIVDYWGDFSATTSCTIPKDAISCVQVKINTETQLICDGTTGLGILNFSAVGGTPPYSYSGEVNGVTTTITNPLNVNDNDKVNVYVIDYNGCISNLIKLRVSCPTSPEPTNCGTTDCPNLNVFSFNMTAKTMDNIVTFMSNLSSSTISDTTKVKGSYKISNVDIPNPFLDTKNIGVLQNTNYTFLANGTPKVSLSNFLEIGFNQLTPTILNNTDSPWVVTVQPYTDGGYTSPTPFIPGTTLTITVALYDEDFCIHKSSGTIVIPNNNAMTTTSFIL
jgi:hypothetical protein